MKRERALLAQSLFLPATLRLRPALIRASRVLPSIPPLSQSVERHSWMIWRNTCARSSDRRVFKLRSRCSSERRRGWIEIDNSNALFRPWNFFREWYNTPPQSISQNPLHAPISKYPYKAVLASVVPEELAPFLSKERGEWN